jgi:hypothetical protein
VMGFAVQLEAISDVHIYQSQTPSKTAVCTTFVIRYWFALSLSRVYLLTTMTTKGISERHRGLDYRRKGISDMSVLCLAGSYFASRSTSIPFFRACSSDEMKSSAGRHVALQPVTSSRRSRSSWYRPDKPSGCHRRSSQ